VDAGGGTWGQHIGFPGRGNDATLWWSPGSIHADPHVLRALDPPRPLLVEVRANLVDTNTGRRLVGVDGHAADHAVVARLRLTPTITAPPPADRLAVFADGIRLAAVRVDPAALTGARIDGALTFVAEGTPSRDYSVSVQALGAGRVAGQQDGPLAGGLLPTSVWRTGDVVTHPFRFDLPPSAGPPEQLILVLYELASGRRLMTSGSRDFAPLGRIDGTGGSATFVPERPS
jgi:hypothetical protein